MKKFLVLTLVLALLAGTCSCKKKESGGNETKDTESIQTSVETEQDEAKSSYEVEIKEDISVVSDTEDGRCTKVLRYPVISGMKDAELQDKINAELASFAEKLYTQTVPDEEIYIIEGTIFNFEIAECKVEYLSDEFISVKNTVNLYTSISEYTSSPVLTLNMNLTDGSILDGDDIFSDFNSVASKFIAGEFTEEYGMKDLLSQTSYEDMILQYRSDYASYPQVYFTSDKIVMNIDLADALGTSAGYSADIDTVKDFLKFYPGK